MDGSPRRPAEPSTSYCDLGQFIPQVASLAAILALFVVFNLEGRACIIVLALGLAAFPPHYFLPWRLKKPYFLVVSLVGLFAVCGSVIGLLILALGGVLVALASLAIRWPVKVGLLALVGAALMAGRAGVPRLGVPEPFWPLFGSLFMFRLMVYLYDHHHRRPGDASALDAACYFLLLPNFCFPLFPVVDYRTFRRSYFARDIHQVHQTGLDWMLRGVLHLLAYRFLYHRLVPDPETIHSPARLAQYIACNYLLYVRVSGQFHLAVGMLHLFGFDLPETHRRWLLASSLTDFWRRINVYWKDFMTKMVYFPVVFRIRHRGETVAVAAGTAAVFGATWLLHAYQAFWLTGAMPFSWTDTLFWTALGWLVVFAVGAARRGPSRRDVPAAWTGRLSRAARTIGTFTLIATLWSLWTAGSPGQWLDLIVRSFHPALVIGP